MEEMLAAVERCRAVREENRIHSYNRLRDSRLELIKHHPEIIDTDFYQYLLGEEERCSVSYEQKFQESLKRDHLDLIPTDKRQK